jgi:hypothetical protein
LQIKVAREAQAAGEINKGEYFDRLGPRTLIVSFVECFKRFDIGYLRLHRIKRF